MAKPTPADYVTLWDLAAEMTTRNVISRDRNWVQLMDAFWRGEFAPHGLTLWQSEWPKQGGEKYPGLTREDLAQVALGEARYAKLGSREALRKLLDWNVGDYDQVRPHYRYYFVFEEEKRGLCSTRADFDNWKERTEPESSLSFKREPSAAQAPADRTPSVDLALEAIKELYPAGLPPGLRAVGRNEQIRKWCKDHAPESPAPSDSSIVRALRRFTREVISRHDVT